jgi:hypothetical protein
MRNSQTLVSIIIPVHNLFELTTACVESVRRHTDLSEYELLIVDDASSEQNARRLDQLVDPQTRIIRNQERL